MSHLYNGLYAVYVLSSTVYAYSARFSENPIMLRILPLLREQGDSTNKALTVVRLTLDDMRKQELREYLSVIYRDEEAYDPLFRSWERYHHWHPSPQLQTVQEIMQQERLLHQQLVLLVPAVQALYGSRDAEYIIPPLLRDEYNQEAGILNELGK